MNTLSEEIRNSFETAFLDKNNKSNLAYRPEFLSNDHTKGKKVLTTIEDNLSTCTEFMFSVAFITESGLTLLLQSLSELEEKGIKGRILTTDYLSFSEPKALEKLNTFSNIEIRMFISEEAAIGFHTKGYIFKKDSLYKIIIGSSNLTQKALSQNKEWNTKIVSTENGQITDEVIKNFEELWNSKHTKVYEEFIDIYKQRYNIIKKQRELSTNGTLINYPSYTLEPNKMQTVFVQKLKELKNKGEKRALLVSATATGKTYASAFGIREINAKKVLFLVHRETIAKQALESYKRVFGKNKSFGLLSGNSKDYDADFLFSTMQMMAKDEIHNKYHKDHFDTIVIDEAHRAGATSYQNIIDYFTPKLWLGMTASPERTDNYNIFDLFDHNIAYEIRLKQALEYDLLCPFHYFGISDLEINGNAIDDKSDFSRLISDERIKHIIDKIEFYGYSGNRVKGLVFCSRKSEAKELSNKFNKLGYKTEALTGEDNENKREEYIDRLESDNRDDYLQYIFTVDIFNEGIDVPSVNQIIMLRPTQSPIIFVQQLGRGLRKSPGKEYVIVLDFIGNYENNYMIPIALSGDTSYKKDNLRRFISEGNRTIPGCSTVKFDKITKEKIFKSIDKEKFNNIEIIKSSYLNLKRKLGRIPSLTDFITYESIDPQKIFDNKNLQSYHMFLKKYEKDYRYYKTKEKQLSEEKEKVLAYISTQFADGKRLCELLLLTLILKDSDDLFKDLINEMSKRGLYFDRNTKINLINIFTNKFLPSAQAASFNGCILICEENKKYHTSPLMKEMLKDNDFYKLVKQTLKYALKKNEEEYGNCDKRTGLQLYAKYTYHDISRILNWHKDEVSLNIGGYKYNKETNTYPVYINYDKSDDISDTIKYEDRFVDNLTLKHISKGNRDLSSNDVKTFLNADNNDTLVELFVRKNKDDKEAKEFYYLGRIHPHSDARIITMENGKTRAVEMTHALEIPVRDDLYDYITVENIIE